MTDQRARRDVLVQNLTDKIDEFYDEHPTKLCDHPHGDNALARTCPECKAEWIVAWLARQPAFAAVIGPKEDR